MKRIICLFPELLGTGGIQEAGRMTAAALGQLASQHHWSAEFLSLNDPSGPHSLEAPQDKVCFRGFGRRKISFFVSGVSRARASDRRSGGIVLAAHPNLAVVSGYMQRLSSGLKTVVMTHGVEVWKPLNSIRRRALLRADLVLTPSRDTAQKLIEVQGVAAARIRRLAWPLNPAVLRLSATPAKLSLPPGFPTAGERVILTVGRWAASERYKGTDELIHSVSKLVAVVPDLHLVAVGGGDDLSRLQRLALDLEVGDRVHFLQNLSREELAACYAHADLFALPSTGEGFGLVFLEAMAFSKPVLGTARGGTTDLIEDGINGLLVPPADVGALTRALHRLLGDASLRADLGNRGAQIVRQKFQFAAFQSELEKILGECDSDVVQAGITSKIL